MERHLTLTLFLVLFANFFHWTSQASLQILLNETAICSSNSSTNLPKCLSLRSNRALPLVSMLTAIPVLADSLSVMEAAQKTYSKINDYLGDDSNSDDTDEDEDRKPSGSKKGSIPPKFKAQPQSKNGSTSAHSTDPFEHHPQHHHTHRRPIIIVQNIVVNLPAPNASTGNFSHLIVNLSNGTNVPAVMISSLTNATMPKNSTELFEDLADDL